MSTAKPAPSAAFRRSSQHRFPLALVKFDDARRAGARRRRLLHPLRRRRNGRGDRQDRAGAPRPAARFEGYTSAADTERKILRDVFETGDAWFRTGDLMRRTRAAYFYFVDRIGDTFRWKGENVATTEVAEALRRFPASSKRMSMAWPCRAPTARRHGGAGRRAISISRLARALAERLPLMRARFSCGIKADIEVTGTFKHKKSNS